MPVRLALLARPLRAAAFGVALIAIAPAGASAAWRAPVDGTVVARFAYSTSHPFARGERRGVDLAARAGEAVRAPCSGTVAYAGRVPAFGRGVSLHCGALTATVLGLAGPLSVRRGQAVFAGLTLGTAGGSGAIRLGARVTADRFAYRDPLRLLGPGPRAPLPVMGTRGPRVRAPGLGPERRVPLPRAVDLPTAARVPAGRAVPASAPAGRTAPAAWAGLALLALATPVGGLVARRRRRRSWAPVPASRSPGTGGRAG